MEKADESLLQDLANDYGDYLLIDTSSEFSKLSQVIKNLSSNLEEFSGLLENIDLDVTLCTDSLLPQIQSHYSRLKETFRQVDQLERAVAAVRSSALAMEEQVTRAELALGQQSVLVSVLRPFGLKKPSNPQPNNDEPPRYGGVRIFETDDLWRPPSE